MARKPSVAIVGSGRLATAMGIALANAGYNIPIVASLHVKNGRRAAKLIGKGTVGESLNTVLRESQDSREMLTRATLILIATADDSIESVAQQLAAPFKATSANIPKRKPIAMHTSGALSSTALQRLKSVGLAVGSLHPLVSISDPRAGARSLNHAFFTIEGDLAAVAFARKLVRDLGGESFQVNAKAKPLYHAAALMASPNLTALFDIALEMLVRSGLSRIKARRVLMPLVESTVENLRTQDPTVALTGTFTRGDLKTAKRHLAAIKDAGLADALAAYVTLAGRSLTMSNEPHNQIEIRRLLARASSAKKNN